MKYFKTYNFFLITESPDIVKDDKTGKVLAYHNEDDARPFGYFKGKFKILSYKGLHGNNLAGLMFSEKSINRDDFKYAGRLWVEKKIISFWDYPENEKVLKSIAKDIKSKSGLNLYEGGWRIELIIGKKRKGNKSVEFLVPIEDYNKWLTVKRTKTELAQDHILSPILKKDKRVPKGVGSKRGHHVWDFQKHYTSEKNNNMKYIKTFESFINEMLI